MRGINCEHHESCAISEVTLSHPSLAYLQHRRLTELTYRDSRAYL